MSDVEVSWLGRVPYTEAWRWQHCRRAAVLEGRAPEVIWMLEHPATVTLGRRGGEVDLAAIGNTPVVRTERGGLATWHGPGQLVGYPILHLGRRRWAVRKTVHGMEQGLMDWLGSLGIGAGRGGGRPGVWDKRGKIGSLGLHVSRGVTIHGFSLNLALGTRAFSGLVPCGLEGTHMTSVAEHVSLAGGASEVALQVGNAVLAGIVAAHR